MALTLGDVTIPSDGFAVVSDKVRSANLVRVAQADTPVTGYMIIKDSTGTDRKVAVVL